MQKEHRILKVEEGSIAWELELSPNDILISVNGKRMEDVFDYHYLIHEEEITLLIQKENGEEWELEIEKEYSQDLGITFENSLMDEYRSCTNKCMFCFIDQMPEGMRDTLYFKDDDSRLSFLQGNYITLTNMKESDIDRIIEYRLEPINVSVHTMNPELRCRMLGNRFAGEAITKLQRLSDAGIEMNGQIVLCKGINDEENLDETIEKLMSFIPSMKSVSVVPVGLTRYRNGLYPLQPFTKEDAVKVLRTIHKWQSLCMQKHGIHFVHGGDEWYLLANEQFPQEDQYDGYMQLENGVGMMRLLIDEFMEELEIIQKEAISVKRRVSIATGQLAAPGISELTTLLTSNFPDLNISVFPIINRFFGEHITVSGLLTGQDLIEQLKGQELGEVLYLPANLLRANDEVLLDDVTLQELETALQVPVYIVKSSGRNLIRELITPKDSK